ncbi:unnamed protein product [marine sediment metagenome]|uniref:Uncharacterized protein n=1 Tax=marine sediment metagenome TaxID=412755 RepID=X1C708_9ZZZZ
MAKLTMDSARLDRDFKREMKNDERKWQIELRKLDNDRDFQNSQLRLTAQRNDFFASLPQQIGGAIAQGYADRPEGQRVQGKARAPALQAGFGESGEFECPYCLKENKQSMVAVGPTANVAQCAACNARFPIQRVDKKTQEQSQEKSQEEQEQERLAAQLRDEEQE